MSTKILHLREYVKKPTPITMLLLTNQSCLIVRVPWMIVRVTCRIVRVSEKWIGVLYRA